MPNVAGLVLALSVCVWLCLAHPSQAQVGADADDSALRIFFNSTGGSVWAQRAGWLLSPVCTPDAPAWFGVTCSYSNRSIGGRDSGNGNGSGNGSGSRDNALGFLRGRGRVTSLQLSANGLNGELPRHLFGEQADGALAWLSELRLSNNPGLRGELPPLRYALSLRYLSVANCSLSGTLQRAFSDAAMLLLEAVHLDNNHFSGPLPAFGTWPNLVAAQLNNNAFRGTLLDASRPLFRTTQNNNDDEDDDDDATIAAATTKVKLRQISEQRNNGRPESSSLSSSTRWLLSGFLRVLDLEDNYLSGSLPEPHGANLTLLNLARNMFSGELPSLRFVPRLETLVLVGNTQIFGTMTRLSCAASNSSSAFSCAPNLALLDLGGTSVDMLRADTPLCMPALRELRLSNLSLLYRRAPLLLHDLRAQLRHASHSSNQDSGNEERVRQIILPYIARQNQDPKASDNRPSSATGTRAPRAEEHQEGEKLDAAAEREASQGVLSPTLADLDLSHNELQGSWGALLVTLSAWFPALAALDLSNSRGISAGGTVCGMPVAPALRRVDLAFTGLSGDDSFLVAVWPTVAYYSVTQKRLFCQFSPGGPALRELDVSGTGLAPSIFLSTIMQPDASRVSVDDSETGLACPVWRHAHADFTLFAPPRYFGYLACACSNASSYWSALQRICLPCPTPGYLCTPAVSPSPLAVGGGASRIAVASGFYPLALLQTVAAAPSSAASMKRERQRPLGGAQAHEQEDVGTLVECTAPWKCAPHGATQAAAAATNGSGEAFKNVYACAPGYELHSLMCTACVQGWHHTSGVCVACPSANVARVFAALSAVCATAFLVRYVLRVRHSSLKHSTLASVVFWLQLGAVLRSVADARPSRVPPSTEWLAHTLGVAEALLAFRPWGTACMLEPTSPETYAAPGFRTLLFYREFALMASVFFTAVLVLVVTSSRHRRRQAHKPHLTGVPPTTFGSATAPFSRPSSSSSSSSSFSSASLAQICASSVPSAEVSISDPIQGRGSQRASSAPPAFPSAEAAAPEAARVPIQMDVHHTLHASLLVSNSRHVMPQSRDAQALGLPAKRPSGLGARDEARMHTQRLHHHHFQDHQEKHEHHLQQQQQQQMEMGMGEAKDVSLPSARSRAEALQFGALLVADVLYLPMMLRAIQLLNCQTLEEASGLQGARLRYLAAAPYLACGLDDSRYAAYYVAAALTVFLLASMPLVLYAACARERRLDARHARAVAGFLWAPYRRRLWWWRIGPHTLRRIALVTAVGALDARSALLPATVLLVILVSVVAQLALRPYRSAASAWLDLVLLMAAAAVYYAHVFDALASPRSVSPASDSEKPANTSGLLAGAAIVQTLVTVGIAAGCLFVVFTRLFACLRRHLSDSFSPRA